MKIWLLELGNVKQRRKKKKPSGNKGESEKDSWEAFGFSKIRSQRVQELKEMLLLKDHIF